MDLRLPALCGGMVVVMLGCKTTQGGSSRVLHDAGQPVALDKSNWVELSRDEYLQKVPKQAGFEAGALLSEGHVLTRRAQFWLDVFDKSLRNQYPDKLQGIPRPLAAVIASPDVNAFVSRQPVCKKIPVRLGAGVTPSIPDAGYITPNWQGVLTIVADDACIPRAVTATDLDSIRKTPTPGSCDIALAKGSTDAAPILQVSAACPLSKALAGKTLAKGLVGPQVANWVTFYSQLFTTGSDEREFAATAAHELGHYYRAHHVGDGVAYNFFYKVGHGSYGKRPVPDPSLAQIGEQAINASIRLERLGSVTVPEDGGFLPALSANLQFIGSRIVALGLCGANDHCTDLCRKFSMLPSPGSSGTGHATALPAQSDPGSTSTVPNPQGGTHLTAVATPAYVRSYLDCASLVAFKLDPKTPPLKQQPLVLFDVWLNATDARIPDSFWQLEAAAAHAADFGAVTTAVNDRLKSILAADQATLQQAFSQGLGYYTDEQEADELSAEWLAKVGIDPKFAVQRYLDFLVSEVSDAHPSTAISMPGPSECRALYGRGWRDRSGKSIFIPIGDYEDAHHNSCYRAFNLDRDIKAHAYVVAPSAPNPPAPSWAELMTTAAGLTVRRP
ncbi:MAG: hypothetical protein NTZ90_13780 [Proteobacteria bacterium]|nr:hypothetical protein [Pseudomonadota bacterium]